MGEFSEQAEQTFRPPVQSVGSLYCYQLLSLRHSPFAPRLFSESTKDMLLQVFQQNNSSAATCHSRVAGGGGATLQLRCSGDNGMNSPAALRYLYILLLVSTAAVDIFADSAPQKRKKENHCQQLLAEPSRVQTTCCSHQLWGGAQRNLRQVTPRWPADINAIKTSCATNQSQWSCFYAHRGKPAYSCSVSFKRCISLHCFANQEPMKSMTPAS